MVADAKESIFAQELEEKLKEICSEYLTDSRPGLGAYIKDSGMGEVHHGPGRRG